jgi:signal transduction histidine kinase/ligand-binding sensor domain-containing protein
MNMKKNVWIISLFFVFIAPHIVWAQEDLKFTRIDGPDGKPIGKIRNITQDPHGYMWFSGEGANCIYKYDGVRITAFKHEESNQNSLGGSFINSIYADSSGIIWIGMNEGLDRFDPATGVFQHFRNDPDDPTSLSAGVTPIIEDRQGRHWFGTDNGLDLLDEKTGKFIHYRNEPDNPKSLSNDVVWNLYEDHQGVLWIATGFPFQNKGKQWHEGGLNRLEPDGTFTQFRHDPNDPHTLINNKVRAMFEDSRGVFWVGTSGDGLHTMDRKTGKFHRHTYDPAQPDKLARPPRKIADDFAFNNDQVTFIQEDVGGSIWIGSMWSGINRYDTLTKKITHYEASNGFPDNSGWNAFESRDGALWISTQEDNLYRVDPFYRPIKRRTNTPTMPLCFLDDNDGNLWVGTEEGGLLQFDQGETLLQQYKHTSDIHSLFDSRNIILSMSYNGGDTIWIGTSDGPGFFNKTTKQFSRLPITIKYNDTPRRNVPNMVRDRRGSLWIVLNGNGLLRYNPRDNSFKQYLNDKKDTTSLTSDHLVSVFEDKNGVIWLSDYTGGINRLDRAGETFTHYLRGTPCHGMYENSGGSFFVGTSSGLYTYDQKGDQFTAILDPDTEIGQLSFILIVEDPEKNLWINNSSALIRVNPTTKETFIYSTKFSIPPYSVHPLAFSKDHKGQFHLGNGNGFYTFYPDEIAMNVAPLKIIVTDFYLNNIPVLAGTESPLKKPIEEINDLVLPFNQNNIGFNFAAIDYRAPESIKYSTMLEGYDNTWRIARGEKSSYYFNVPPGQYVYRIKAYNSDGTMGEKSITIHITPPWWKTWWAYGLYGVGFLALAWTTHRYQRQRVIRSEREKAQEKELAQAKEIEKAYTDLKATQALLIQSEKMASLGELTAGIAHEIQNPLNFVNNFSELNKELIEELKDEKAKEKSDRNEKLEEELVRDIAQNLEKIIHHGKRADAIVKGMLHHSRNSSGIHEPTDINALCDEYLRLSYHGLRAKDKTFNVTLKTSFGEGIGSVNVIPQDIGRVILNILNNAFYAVSDKKNQGTNGYEPTVSLSTKKSAGSVLISVKDNGNGIPEEVLGKIFQPFFTTKPTGQGTGLGLSLCYDIVKAHGGELKVETRVGNGTEFTIHLPIKN